MAKLHSKIIKELRCLHHSPSERELLVMQGEKDLGMLIYQLFGWGASQVRLTLSGQDGKLEALKDNEWRGLPDPPAHMIERIVGYVENDDTNSGTSIAQQERCLAVVVERRERWFK